MALWPQDEGEHIDFAALGMAGTWHHEDRRCFGTRCQAKHCQATRDMTGHGHWSNCGTLHGISLSTLNPYTYWSFFERRKLLNTARSMVQLWWRHRIPGSLHKMKGQYLRQKIIELKWQKK